MHIRTFRTGLPAEPVRFARRLSRLPPERSAIALAKAVPNMLLADEHDFEQTRDLGPLTLHLLQRALLLRAGEPPVWVPPDAKIRDLKYFLRQFLAMRASHPALRRRDEPPVARATRILWLTLLEQELLSANPKHDMARAWIMYDEVWPDLVRTGAVTIRPGLMPTAIGATHNALLLLVGVALQRGYIAVPSEYFATTPLGPQMSTLLHQLATPVGLLKVALREAAAPERSFRNAFADHPLVMLEDGGLLAPDPAILVNSFERAFLTRLLRDFIEEEGQAGFDDASSAFGLVFEEYGRRLLNGVAGLGAGLGGAFLGEFKYRYNGQEIASPDAFILSPGRSLVVEFKATRYPHDLSTLADDPVSHLWMWMSKLLGATANRPALRQGADFFERAQGLPEVAEHDLDRGLYVVCTYPRVPQILNFNRWRREALMHRGLLEPLFSRTAFVSVGDLEITATAASSGCAPSFLSIVHDWWNAMRQARDVQEICSLGDFVLGSYPAVRSHDYPLLAAARTRLFSAASTAAFGDAIDMPRNWWLV